jgi:uncharacterized protein (DUF1778 family)
MGLVKKKTTRRTTRVETDVGVNNQTRASDETPEREQLIRLTKRDWEQFLAVLKGDARPNRALRKAAERFQRSTADT